MTATNVRLDRGLDIGRFAGDSLDQMQKDLRQKRLLCYSLVMLTDLIAKPSGYYENARQNLLKYIPNDVKRTLEFGCAQGGFSALIRERLGAETWAVEIDEAAAKEAAKRLDRVIHSDAAESLTALPDGHFDCIVFLDILEHLVDPYSLLVSVKRKLTARGVVVASIPNVRYYRNYVNFAIKGDWDYQDAGILDKTHLRFFTCKSLRRTFEGLGYKILLLEGIAPTRKKRLRLLNLLLLGALDDVKYRQFVVVAAPTQI